MKVIKIILLLVVGILILIEIMAYRFYYIPWDDSDEIKRADCERAIIETEFDKTVLTNIENYTQLNKYILNNFDSIIDAKMTLTISLNDKRNGMIKLDNRFIHLYDQLLNNKISTIDINSNHTIEYKLYDIDVPKKARNYYSRHSLIYGHKPKEKLKDTILTSLYKAKAINLSSEIFYQIQIDPYIGW
jgi:hypothetical protein